MRARNKGAIEQEVTKLDMRLNGYGSLAGEF